MKRTTYNDLKQEIEEYNKRQGSTNVLGEHHESGIYSILLDGKTLKITNLSDAISNVRFLNNYFNYAKVTNL